MPRERQFTWQINGKPYEAMRDEHGAPVYSTQAVPRIAGETAQIAEEERQYPSLHGGFGHSRYLIPSTYDFGDCIDTTRPRRIIMPPLMTSLTAASAVTGGFMELGSNLWVGAGRYLQAINTTNDTIATPDNADYTKGFDAGSGAVISSLLPWDGSLDVWFSSATNGRTFNGSTAPTELSGSSVQRGYAGKFFSVFSNSMVQAASATVSSDPCITWIAQGAALDSAIGANWVTQYDIGDDTEPITGVAAGRRQVWIAKSDGLYQVDGQSGQAPREVEFFPIHDDNGKRLFVDSAQRVWCCTKGGLLRAYRSEQFIVEDLTPGRNGSHTETIYGTPTGGVVQYKGRFFVAMYNGTTSYVMEGRDTADGFVWHGAIAKLTGQITHLYVGGQTSPPRLWMAAGTAIAYIRLDAPERYAPTGKIYLPADNFGALGSRWHLAGFVVTCKGFNSSTYADLYAKLDNGDWQLVNRLQASGRVFIPIPSGDWRFTEMAFYFDLTSASSTTTPEIWGVTPLATRRVYTRSLIQISLICSKRVLSKYGIEARRSGQEMVRELDALAIAGPVVAIDYLTGEARERRVLVQPIRTRVVRFGEKGKWEEWGEVVDVTMVALSSEAVQVEAPTSMALWGSFDWGDGTRWG